MDVYAIPFESQFIIYRPLRRLAFLANAATLAQIRAGLGGRRCTDRAAERFLKSIGFWEPDPPAPAPSAPNGEHRPTEAVLLMTGACNLRCTYCYARGGEQPGLRMTLPLARTIIDHACKNALARMLPEFRLTFHGGGEPTANWAVLVGAVQYARSRALHCRIGMSSNGVWTARQRRFILANFDHLSISFDGVREVHDAQRPQANGSGSFDAVVETLHALDAAKRPYGVRLTATPTATARLSESVAWLCENTRGPLMQVEPAYADRRGGHARPTLAQGRAFASAFMEAFRIAEAHGRRLAYSGSRPAALCSAFCRAASDSLVVTPEGDIVTCYETHDRRHPMLPRCTIGRAAAGHIDIDAARVRRYAAWRSRCRDACAGCFCYWHCGGDCTVRRATPGRRDSGRCAVNREITRQLLASRIAAAGGVWTGAPAPASAEPC